VKSAFAGFGDPIVFLFFGTFLLTDAAGQHGLIQRLTRAVLGSEMVRRKPARLLWAIAFLGCGISAWMNNTATTPMLLPLALAAWWLQRGAGEAKHAGVTAVTHEARPWSRAERTLVPLFVIVVLLWILPGILAGTPLQSTAWLKAWQARLPEPAVPVLGALAL